MTNHAKGFAPVVKFPTGGVALLLAGAGRSRKDVKRRLWFFNTKREPVEVLDVLPVSVIARTWPEPCREAPENGREYYVPAINDSWMFASFIWANTPKDLRRLECGMVHTTLEAAQAHAEALLSLCK